MEDCAQDGDGLNAADQGVECRSIDENGSEYPILRISRQADIEEGYRDTKEHKLFDQRRRLSLAGSDSSTGRARSSEGQLRAKIPCRSLLLFSALSNLAVSKPPNREGYQYKVDNPQKLCR